MSVRETDEGLIQAVLGAVLLCLVGWVFVVLMFCL
jgi:hypothetical protein